MTDEYLNARNSSPSFFCQQYNQNTLKLRRVFLGPIGVMVAPVGIYHLAESGGLMLCVEALCKIFTGFVKAAVEAVNVSEQFVVVYGCFD